MRTAKVTHRGDADGDSDGDSDGDGDGDMRNDAECHGGERC